MRAKRLWFNSKYKFYYVGTYERDKKGERMFILTATAGKHRRITFESFQMAIKLGWQQDV